MKITCLVTLAKERIKRYINMQKQTSHNYYVKNIIVLFRPSEVLYPHDASKFKLKEPEQTKRVKFSDSKVDDTNLQDDPRPHLYANTSLITPSQSNSTRNSIRGMDEKTVPSDVTREVKQMNPVSTNPVAPNCNVTRNDTEKLTKHHIAFINQNLVIERQHSNHLNPINNTAAGEEKDAMSPNQLASTNNISGKATCKDSVPFTSTRTVPNTPKKLSSSVMGSVEVKVTTPSPSTTLNSPSYQIVAKGKSPTQVNGKVSTSSTQFPSNDNLTGVKEKASILSSQSDSPIDLSGVDTKVRTPSGQFTSPNRHFGVKGNKSTLSPQLPSPGHLAGVEGKSSTSTTFSSATGIRGNSLFSSHVASGNIPRVGIGKFPPQSGSTKNLAAFAVKTAEKSSNKTDLLECPSTQESGNPSKSTSQSLTSATSPNGATRKSSNPLRKSANLVHPFPFPSQNSRTGQLSTSSSPTDSPLGTTVTPTSPSYHGKQLCFASCNTLLRKKVSNSAYVVFIADER